MTRASEARGLVSVVIPSKWAWRPLTSSDWAAYVEEQLEDIDDPAELAERRSRIEEMGMRETMPAYASLTADALGHLWVNVRVIEI